MSDDAQGLLYVAAESGPAYWGPGDRYTFLVTGAQSGGSYFILEAFVPPGGGPPAGCSLLEQAASKATLRARMGRVVRRARGGIEEGRAVTVTSGDWIFGCCWGIVYTFKNVCKVCTSSKLDHRGVEWFARPRKKLISPVA